MKIRMLIVFGMLLLSTTMFSQDSNFHIYLCFGQSNMEGSATIENQDKVANSRFLALQPLNCDNLLRNKNTWYPAIPPLSQCYTGLSPADYFGKTMIKHLPDSIKVGVVNVAVGGSDIRLFDKAIYKNYINTYPEEWFAKKIRDYGGNPYQHFINLAKLAQEKGVIKGILLHQGETNQDDKKWPEYVKVIYNNMLQDLSLKAEDVPLLAGELVNEDQKGVCASMNPIINTLPNVVSTAHVISSKGCKVRDDYVHFNSAGVRELGKRYALKMLDLKGYNEEKLSVKLNVTGSSIKYTEVIDSLPVRNTRYRIRVPKNWNGRLISDFDYYDAYIHPQYERLLKDGYAFCGPKRRTDRLENYDPAHEIHDLVSILDIFEDKFGKPKRTIQYGCSGGANVTIGMAEIHPDRIDGAIAVGTPTSMWMANSYLDALFVLKALIAPDLPIVGFPLKDPEKSKMREAWKKAIKKAQQTSEGKARIALALTIGQWPAWGGYGQASYPEPNVHDIEKLQESMFDAVLRRLPAGELGGYTMLERAAGLLSGNQDVDYVVFFNNGNPQYKKAVEKLYKNASVSLKNDLQTINAFPRIVPEASAVKWWSSPGRTHVGEPKVPVFRMHNNGDGLVIPGITEGYETLVKENGYSSLFRSAYIQRWGHCAYTVSETLTAFEILNKRIDTGIWGDTDPDALNKLAQSLDSNSPSKFFDYQKLKRYNRIWVPFVADFQGNTKE